MILAYNALNAFQISLQKHDALCGLGKREGEKKRNRRTCKLGQGVEKIKKEMIKVYKSVKREQQGIFQNALFDNTFIGSLSYEIP